MHDAPSIDCSCAPTAVPRQVDTFTERSFTHDARRGYHARGMRTLARLIVAVAAAVVLLALAAVGYIRSTGLRGQPRPGPIETQVARSLRSFAIPAAAKARTMPAGASQESMRLGMEHFARYCALCHANNGSGEAEIGRGLYPRAPDMRAGATQNLTDGELFSIIENGIRLTGMPAWGTGTAEGVRASWALVHFIRRLPTLTDEEIERMEALNPKTAEQWRQEEEARRFLAGDDATPPPVSTHKHDGSQP